MTFPDTTFVQGTTITSNWLNAVNDKCMELVSVQDYGAVGDGVTDDSTAILAAFNYVRSIGGGIVDFPNNDSIYLVAYGFAVPTNTIVRLNGCTIQATIAWGQGTLPTNATARSQFAIYGSLTNGATLTSDTQNVAIIGDNAVINMRYDDQTGTRPGGSGIGIATTPAPIVGNLWKVHDIIVKDVTVKNALWYGTYVEGAKNVLFDNVNCDNSWNIGHVVVCGWNVSYQTCRGAYSRNGVGNQGVGFWNEANETWQLLRNIRYYNCVAEYNNRSGFRYYNDGDDVEVSIVAVGNISRFNLWNPNTNTQYSSPSDAGHVIQKTGGGTADHLIKLIGCIAEEEYNAGFKVLRVATGTNRQSFLFEDCVAYNCNKQNLSSYTRSPFHVATACDSNVYISNPLVIAPAANTIGYGIGLESSDHVFITTPRFVGTFEYQLITGGVAGVARKDAGWDVAWDNGTGHIGSGTPYYKPVRLASFDQTSQPSTTDDLYTNELAIWQDDTNQFTGIYRRDDSSTPKYLDFQSKKRIRHVESFAGITLAAGGIGGASITVTGVALGDIVQMTATVDNQQCILYAYVSAANTIRWDIYNPTGSSQTLGVGYLVFNVLGSDI